MGEPNVHTLSTMRVLRANSGSVTQAGPLVGAMIASRFLLAISPSIALWAPGVAIARCAAHFASRPPGCSASQKIAEFQSDSGAPDSNFWCR